MNMPQIEEFWIVWNPQGDNPHVRHHNQEDAIREARRLAGANTGHEFVVLKSIGTARRVDVDFVEHIQAIPF